MGGAVLTGDQALVVHHAFRPGGSVQVSEVGTSIPWNTCALGKAVVAHAPQALRDQLLAGELAVPTGASIDDPARMARELEQIRATGYAVEDQEAAVGEAGIASPVYDSSGPVGAIGVVGPVERLLAGPVRVELAVAVREAGRSLSRDLGAPRGAGGRA
ncbi:hypothetical protein OG735_01335 [Streptomyces sp. NBC_01210]|uniref:IclR family transcriptional regulator n=1 Tax=Streptomyces sp. NBC_01210 TaxID=2903774 RepID=UPI002E1386E3|nr:hypothetical protein OG735_01335 [Streptomyces sp. NBC_01210]